MKNWKKVMAMLCTAAMVTGFSAPVWAEADAAEDTEAAADDITELNKYVVYPNLELRWTSSDYT